MLLLRDITQLFLKFVLYKDGLHMVCFYVGLFGVKTTAQHYLPFLFFIGNRTSGQVRFRLTGKEPKIPSLSRQNWGHMATLKNQGIAIISGSKKYP